MKITTYRNDEFINREKEIEFLKHWFNSTPKEILWLYGPKSTGKTTLIEYVLEKELLKDETLFSKSNYWIKYINFRGLMVGSYDSFISSFFEESDEDEFSQNYKGSVNLGVIKLEASLFQKIKEKKVNLFNELIEKLRKINKTKIIVIDEIQTLEDIYINGEKELLKEFLNFCVRLTKETHLSHVVILSSNTIFINRIYNDAKLKITSKFKKIDHFDKETTFEYLKLKGFNSEECELIWEYLGGCIAKISRMLRDKYEFDTLQEYLDSEARLALGEIKFFMLKKCSLRETKIFKSLAKEIVKKGFIILDEDDKEKNRLLKVVEKFAEVEILFFNPLSNRVEANNRLYYKAMEML